MSFLQIQQTLNKWAKNKEDNTVLTVGKIKTIPGSINVIPEQTSFTVDVRIHEESQFDLHLNEIKQIIHQIINDHSLDYEINEIRTQSPIPFSSNLTEMVENICKEKELSYKTMKSGAGHDAKYMNKIAETVMIFVPSISGKSHSPEEQTEWSDIKNGVNVLYEVMKRVSSDKTTVRMGHSRKNSIG